MGSFLMASSNFFLAFLSDCSALAVSFSRKNSKYSALPYEHNVECSKICSYIYKHVSEYYGNKEKPYQRKHRELALVCAAFCVQRQRMLQLLNRLLQVLLLLVLQHGAPAQLRPKTLTLNQPLTFTASHARTATAHAQRKNPKHDGVPGRASPGPRTPWRGASAVTPTMRRPGAS